MVKRLERIVWKEDIRKFIAESTKRIVRPKPIGYPIAAVHRRSYQQFIEDSAPHDANAYCDEGLDAARAIQYYRIKFI